MTCIFIFKKRYYKFKMWNIFKVGETLKYIFLNLIYVINIIIIFFFFYYSK